MSKIRVRFAPSPTGPLHIGGARSALFNYLLAAKAGGDFILRMEDTDRERSTPESEENIKDSLRWLGIQWNEGIDIGGPYAPYRQMERLDTYQKVAEQLIAEGKAYYCYCSEAEIEEERQAQLAKGETSRYGGRCRHLTEEERAEKEAQGIKPVVRFAVPPGQDIVIEDQVRGRVVFQSDGEGDFILMKSDGIPTYHFAVVVDDHLMQITHIVRAEEHLSNTPRQLLLYEALGWEKPVFAHVSLILGKDRSKMSKRHGSVSVTNYRDQGYLPQALVNFLALLGWAPEEKKELFTMEELIAEFSLSRVSKSPAVFDLDKLKWLNGQYLHQLDLDQVVTGITPYLDDSMTQNTANLQLLAATLQNHLLCFSDVKEFMPLIQGGLPQWDAECAAIMQKEQVPGLLRLFASSLFALPEMTPEEVKKTLKACGKELGVKGADLFMPVRIAATGMQHGPDIDKLIALMGKHVLDQRLTESFARLQITKSW